MIQEKPATSGAAVAVLGAAWSTALGADLAQVWGRLLDGETGFQQVPDKFRLRNDLAALIEGSVPGTEETALPESPGPRLRKLAEQTILRALQAAGIGLADPPVDLILGTSLGDFLESPDAQRLDGWAQDVAHAIGATGQCISLSTACSSSADAILVGAEIIRSGASQVCVCGGADVVSSAKRQGHSGLGTLSPTTLKPLDENHEGTLLGEGAAFLVLASEEFLATLNPPEKSPQVWLRGAGSANDGASMSGPDPEGRGARFAIERSLADAGISTQEVHVINAHGSGTQLNDETETATYLDLFPPAQATTIFATKGAFGHTLGATGAMEAIALIQALRRGQVPPIAGLETPLTAAAGLRLAVKHPVELSETARFGLSLTLGFGGFDTSLVFEVQR